MCREPIPLFCFVFYLKNRAKNSWVPNHNEQKDLIYLNPYGKKFKCVTGFSNIKRPQIYFLSIFYIQLFGGLIG